MKWKPNEIATAIKKREEGKTWPEIAEEMTNEGFPERSSSNYSSTIAKFKKKYDLKLQDRQDMSLNIPTHWKDDPATRRQCKFIASLTLPNGTTKEKKVLEDKLAESAKEGNFTKAVASEQIDLLTPVGSNLRTHGINPRALGTNPRALGTNPRATKGKGVKNNKHASSSRWTLEEDAIVTEWKVNKDKYPPTTLFTNRTKKAIQQRWQRSLKHRVFEIMNRVDLDKIVIEERVTNTASTKEEYEKIQTERNKPVRLNNEESKSFSKTNGVWSYDESLSLLVSFPEISIEEARETYQRPYWVIAKHYEKHYDLTYVVSEELVMKATEIRKQMKRNMKPEKKPSLLKRWKQRRIAKRENRLNRKLDKAVTKLSKLQKKVNIDGKF